MINERTIFFLTRAQRLLGLFALRDVLNHRLKLPRARWSSSLAKPPLRHPPSSTGRVALRLKQPANPALMPHHLAVRLTPWNSWRRYTAGGWPCGIVATATPQVAGRIIPQGWPYYSTGLTLWSSTVRLPWGCATAYSTGRMQT